MKKIIFLFLFLFLVSCSQEADISKGEEETVLKNKTCEQVVADLSVEEKIGQLFMLGLHKGELSQSLKTMIKNQHIGSVIFLGNMKDSKEELLGKTEKVQELSQSIPMIIAVDQEGGLVQRVQGEEFSKIPSAMKQGEMTDELLLKNWEKWGEELNSVGIHYNLGPVGDYVGADYRSENKPIALLERNLSFDADTIVSKSKSVIQGLNNASILISLKHFPGIGNVVENTDFGIAKDSISKVDATMFRVFRDIIASGVDSVMISSTLYSKIDAENQAVFSKKIITDVLREEYNFQGVVISDDLGVAVSVGDIAPKDRGVRFLKAGGDLIINANPKIQEEMYNGVKNEFESDKEFEKLLDSSVLKVLKMKKKVGLITCE